MKALLNKIRFGVVAVVIFAVAPAAHAGGFFGELIDDVAPGVGTALDQYNDEAGNPVDHIGAAVVDYYVPGAGRAMEMNWEYNRMRNEGYDSFDSFSQSYNDNGGSWGDVPDIQ